MTKEELEKVREELLAEKSKIEKELDKLKESLDFGNDIETSMEEESDESEEMGNYLGVKKTQDERLEQINKALEKISKGTYGICEKCGNEIEREVIAAYPESLLCKKCKRGA